MRKVVGILAACAIVGAIYLMTAGASNWDWAAAALVFGAAIGVATVLIGLVALVIWGFTK